MVYETDCTSPSCFDVATQENILVLKPETDSFDTAYSFTIEVFYSKVDSSISMIVKDPATASDQVFNLHVGCNQISDLPGSMRVYRIKPGFA